MFNEKDKKNKEKTPSFLEIITNKKQKKNDGAFLMPWEKKLVNNKEYDEDQFEEEDMDEEDYYYEDD